jgi:hypothetical protein
MDPSDPRSNRKPDRFAEELLGLDPGDEEVQAFAAHLDRIEHPNSRATVEGMLEGVENFADSANRARGHRRVLVVLVVVLMLGGVALTVWNALVAVLSMLLG